MKEGLSKRTPKDPHDWEKRPAVMVDKATNRVVAGGLFCWLCRRCGRAIIQPPEGLHDFGDCHEQTLDGQRRGGPE